MGADVETEGGLGIPPALEKPTGNLPYDLRDAPDKAHFYYAARWLFTGLAAAVETIATILVLTEHPPSWIVFFVCGLPLIALAFAFGMLAHFERKAIRAEALKAQADRQTKRELEFAAAERVFDEQNRRHVEEIADRDHRHEVEFSEREAAHKAELAELDSTIEKFTAHYAQIGARVAEWDDPQVIAEHVVVRFDRVVIFDSGSAVAPDKVYLAWDVFSLSPRECEARMRSLQIDFYRLDRPGVVLATHNIDVKPLYERFNGSRFVWKVMRRWESREDFTGETTAALRETFREARMIAAVVRATYVVMIDDEEIEFSVNPSPQVPLAAPPRSWTP